MEPAKSFYIRQELPKKSMLSCFSCSSAYEEERTIQSWGKKWSVCAKVVRHPNVNEDEVVMEAVAVNKQQVQGAKPSSAGLAV